MAPRKHLRRKGKTPLHQNDTSLRRRDTCSRFMCCYKSLWPLFLGTLRQFLLALEFYGFRYRTLLFILDTFWLSLLSLCAFFFSLDHQQIGSRQDYMSGLCSVFRMDWHLSLFLPVSCRHLFLLFASYTWPEFKWPCWPLRLGQSIPSSSWQQQSKPSSHIWSPKIK